MNENKHKPKRKQNICQTRLDSLTVSVCVSFIFFFFYSAVCLSLLCNVSYTYIYTCTYIALNGYNVKEAKRTRRVYYNTYKRPAAVEGSLILHKYNVLLGDSVYYRHAVNNNIQQADNGVDLVGLWLTSPV